MSASSSGSWAPDILDLDRFMRGARAQRRKPINVNRRGLVVNRGSPRKPVASSSGTESLAPRDKRLSHDSGLSETSYVRRRRRRRRSSCSESRHRDTGRSNSRASLRAFRAAFSRALRDQQEQLSRVAQLCDRLAQRARPSSDDLSSSSRRSEECKTYNIIMTRLNELLRLYAGKRRPHPAARPRVSSSSVSVADKLVATEAEPSPATVLSKRERSTKMLERAFGDQIMVERTPRCMSSDCSSTRRRRRPAVGGAPASGTLGDFYRQKYGNTVERSSSPHGSSSVGDGVPQGFDLDNPVHLYEQAKRLQTLHATSQRVGHHGTPDVGAGRGTSDVGASAGRGKPGVGSSRWSLCALCRGYVRALRQFLVEQLCPDTDAC